MTYISNVRLTGRTKYKAPFVETPGPTPAEPDSFFSNVSLLLQPESTETTIVDKSPLSLGIINTNVTLTSTEVAQTGKAMDFISSFQPRGLDISHPSAFNFGVANYTIEAWLYMTFKVNTITAFNHHVMDSNGRLLFARTAAGSYVFRHENNDISNGVGTDDWPVNEWFHIAVSRDSGILRMFINGVLKSTGASANGHDAGNNIIVGNGPPIYFSLDYNLNGLMNNFRITKGVARYTANFTPVTVFATE